MLVYKLTDKDMQTFGGCQWTLLVPQNTDGSGELCGPGWLHWYLSPEVAVFMNSAHGNFDPATMRLFEAEAEGQIKVEKRLKGGSTKLTLVREIAVPVITREQRIEIGIRCAKEVCTDEKWNKWADRWLSGTDRSASSACAAVRAAEAAAWARAAAVRAADAAAWAADAAEARAEARAAAWAACAAVRAAEAAACAADAAARAADAAAWAAEAVWVAKGDKGLDLVSIAKKVMGV